MLTERLFKSTFLIIVTSLLAIGILSSPKFVSAQEETDSAPLLFSILYTSDSCFNCDSIAKELQEMIIDIPEIVVSVRNIKEEKYAIEFEYLQTECSISASQLPVFVTETGCATEKSEMIEKLNELITLFEEVKSETETESPVTSPDSEAPDGTGVDTDGENTPEVPASDLIDSTPREVELNLPILIFTLTVPIAMYFAGMYIIKRFKL